MKLDEAWIDRFIEAEKLGVSNSPGIPSDQVIENSFGGLVEELNRQSNVSYEVDRLRAEAKAAVLEKDMRSAKSKLDEVAWITKNTADHATVEYARSLAALGNLGFTELNFAEARSLFDMAI